MELFDLIRQDAYISINKELARTIGLVETVLYSELVSKYKYWKDREQLTEEEWFYCTSEQLEHDTATTRKKRETAIRNLKKHGLIETKRIGLPAKTHYKITSKIYELLNQGTNKNAQNVRTDDTSNSEDKNRDEDCHNQYVQNGQTGMSETDKIERPNRTPNKNRVNNHISNKNRIKSIYNEGYSLVGSRLESWNEQIDEHKVTSIINQYQKFKELLSEQQFIHVVSNVLEQPVKSSFEGLLHKSLENKCGSQKEVLPSWFKGKQDNSRENNEVCLDNLAQRVKRLTG